MQAWDYLRRFARLTVRGAGTEGERQAARWLQAELEGLGYDVEMQSFRTPRHTLYLGPAIVGGVLLIAMGLAKTAPVVASALALVSFVPLLGEVLGAGLNFDLVLPKRPSQNVYATRSSSERDEDAKGTWDGADGGTGEAPVQHIIVAAHYDAQWGSWLFAPAFRPLLQPFFYVTYGGFAAGLVAVVLRSFAPGSAAATVATNVAWPLVVVTCGFLVLSWATGKTVPGANDNGSGVAVALALAEWWAAEPLPNVRLSFLFTGAEEVGMRGMHHFVRRARQEGLDSNTMFVNLDNVGGGQLRYMLGEGMLGYQHYDAVLVALARRLAEECDDGVLPLQNTILPTDALIPAKAGYPAITFLAARDDESIPEYHWHTDTLENVNRGTVEQTERFVRRFLEELAARVQASSA